jgi:hypothetical protein
MPVVSQRDVKLTVSPKRQYLGILFPMTPVTISPQLIPIVILCKNDQLLFLDVQINQTKKILTTICSPSQSLNSLALSIMSNAARPIYFTLPSTFSGKPSEKTNMK